jgi:superfamily II DNA or RNA helicase
MRRSSLPSHYRPRPPITPRKLQVVSFQEIMLGAKQGHPRQTVVAPPGFGKSLLGLMFAGHLVRKGVSLFAGAHRPYRGALIVVPTLSLMPTFTTISEIVVPEEALAVEPRRSYKLDVASMWRQKIGDNPRSATEDEIVSLFRQGGLAIITYQALHQIWGVVPKNLSQWILILDEAHHAPLAHRSREGWTAVARKRDLWQERGGTVLQASATPWHTESGHRIYDEAEPRSVTSIGDLRRAKLAPSSFEFHRIMLDIEAKTWKDMLLEGKPSAALVRAYGCIPEYWISQGRPVTVIRPPDRSHVAHIQRAFKAAGLPPERILDATGEDFDGRKLARAREITSYAEREYDIIIACRRFDEGTDLPSVSNVYYIGAPSSVRLVVQLLGRTLRIKKLPDYPKQWKDKSAMTVFIPRNEASPAEWRQVHMEDATLLAAYISDVEVGDRIISHLATRLRESLVYGHEPGDAVGARSRIIGEICGDDVTKAEARAELTRMIARTARERNAVGAPMDEAGAKAVAEKILQVKRPGLRSAMITAFAENVEEHPEIVEELRRAYEDIVESARADATLDDQIHAAHVTLREAFRRVAEKFSHLHKIRTDRGILHVISKFTGLDSDQIAIQIRRLCMTNPTRAEVVRAIHSHVRRKGTYPIRSSGSADKDGLPGYTWKTIADNWQSFGFDEDSLEDYGRMLLGRGPSRTRRRR